MQDFHHSSHHPFHHDYGYPDGPQWHHDGPDTVQGIDLTTATVPESAPSPTPSAHHNPAGPADSVPETTPSIPATSSTLGIWTSASDQSGKLLSPATEEQSAPSAETIPVGQLDSDVTASSLTLMPSLYSRRTFTKTAMRSSSHSSVASWTTVLPPSATAESVLAKATSGADGNDENSHSMILDSSTGGSGASNGAIVASVFGGLAALIAVFILVWWWQKRRLARQERSLLTPVSAPPTSESHSYGTYEFDNTSVGPTPWRTKAIAAVGYNVEKLGQRLKPWARCESSGSSMQSGVAASGDGQHEAIPKRTQDDPSHRTSFTGGMSALVHYINIGNLADQSHRNDSSSDV